jgi:hypothetical protein
MTRFSLSGAVLAVALILATPALSYAALDLNVDIALSAPVVETPPPPLPIYVVPAPPQQDLVWMPGYWFWDEDYGEYFWTPGTWVQPPVANVVWTPGYWGWVNGRYAWNQGYWGPHVGFYGGVNYGGGYDGIGFHGGSWQGGHYIVNRAFVNVNNVRNVNAVISFNGGPGGIGARPTARQEQFAHERHLPPTQNQISHIHEAGSDHALFYDANHGRPNVAATQHPADFRQAVAARGANNPAPQNHFAPAPMAAPRQPNAPHVAQPSHPQPPERPQAVQPHNEGQIQRPEPQQQVEQPHPQAVQQQRPQAVQQPPRMEPQHPQSAPEQRHDAPHPQGGEHPHEGDHQEGEHRDEGAHP